MPHAATTLLAAVATLGLIAADEPKTQTVDADGLSFQAPAAWKKAGAPGPMRRAQLAIEPEQGDDYPGELVVFAFPGGAGGVEANVERWQSQFRGKDGAPPKADVKVVPGQNVKVHRVEIAGDYRPPQFPGQPPQPARSEARLLGAIVITDQVGYFLRLIGPDNTVKKISGDFDKLIASIKLQAR